MERKIIKINESRCNGCGLCVNACHEGAIALIDGKAKLTRDDYCDGLGDCLPACPVNAITFEVRDALAYDEKAVLAAKQGKETLPCGCPGSQAKALAPTASLPTMGMGTSQLLQWPVQIQLVPVQAAYLQHAHLLIAADCCAYAYANFHQTFMQNKVTLIGCPKLDACEYSEKLLQILLHNDIQSVTVVRMEVPCCGGIEHAAKTAIQKSGKFLPWHVVTISTNGTILS